MSGHESYIHSTLLISKILMSSISSGVLTACIAALPPFVAVAVSLVRDGIASPRRTRQLEDAQKLVSFTKAWTEAAVSADVNIPQESRDALQLVLVAAAESVSEVATCDRIERLERRQLELTGFLLPRWPDGSTARGYAAMYYYMLIGSVGSVFTSIFLIPTEMGTLWYANLWALGVQLLIAAAILPYLRRKAIVLDESTAALRIPAVT